MNRYPLWKYILLIAIVLFGVLYSLPNFFGEDPVLQIQGTQQAKVTKAVKTQIQSVLTEHRIAFKSAALGSDGLLIVRFPSVTEQMQAKELIQANLGNQFTVAQNLLSVTPSWLQAIGAEPMRLGLDLRGGVHFLLQVDVNSVIKKRLAGDVRTIATSLRKADIRYAGIRQVAGGKIQIKFRSDAARDNAQSALEKELQNYVIEPATEAGQLLLNVSMSPAAISQLRDYTMSQTMTVLRNRVDALGVAEPSISRQGLDRIVVELPGVQDMAMAKQILGGTATLEFHLVDDKNDLQSAVNGIIPLGSRLYHFANGQPILLKNQVVLAGSAITFAAPGFDQSGNAAVNLRISGPQVSNFSRITGSNIGRRLAIVYVETVNTPKLVNGKVVNTAHKVEHVISAPVIQSALPSNFQITNMGSVEEAKRLSIQLKAGALPANMYPIQEKNVGPSLGAANIQRGIISVIAGFILIVIFMLMYYRLMGLFANLALFMNVVFIVAVMSIIGVTMTLPGIAAVVLTMGMAVDANVLIFERIREEMRNGSTIQAAIHAGYERAFATIVDANVTTLIVAIALFAIGTGAVQGFAVTLIIGLVTSMITAIMGTRAIVNLVYGGRTVKKLSIGIK